MFAFAATGLFFVEQGALALSSSRHLESLSDSFQGGDAPFGTPWWDTPSRPTFARGGEYLDSVSSAVDADATVSVGQEEGALSPPEKYFDCHGASYLESLSESDAVAATTPATAVGAKDSDDQVGGGDIGLRGEVDLLRAKVYHLEREVDRLGQENSLVKRAATDLMSRWEELAPLLEDMDDHRLDIMRMTAKCEDTIFKAVDLFPDEEELASYEWLTKPN